ncbi:HPr-rel-A system PqqD family peptide chaperone [Kordiimonas sp.]|uniref:HPr-rel-A system PqqD family peptide chaperone n=1 Tax=Kordiimonas sp. TaxID=1970157 RepID=UPI003A8EEF1F
MPQGDKIYNDDRWLWYADQSHFSVEALGDISYVYCRRSGSTHVFNLVSIEMLQYLTIAPRRVSELVEAFPSILGVSREECPRGFVKRIFAELDDAGLLTARAAGGKP